MRDEMSEEALELTGNVNPHIVGIVMKEAVRRAIVAIRSERFIFESQVKQGYSGNLDDMVTSADHKAQQIYVRMLTECFPDWGIVAEEEGLRVPCSLPGEELFFTVDPLDGTKAYVRKQSHGIATMISLVRGARVIAAYVGDVMTQEIYGYRPGSSKTHRISEFEHIEALSIDSAKPLREQYILLRKAPDRQGEVIRGLLSREAGHRRFRDLEVTSGSIGASMARLWKGEVGAAVLNPGHETPWDMCPIIGISLQLGFVFLRANAHGKLERFTPQPVHETRRNEIDILIVHKSRLRELGEIVAAA